MPPVVGPPAANQWSHPLGWTRVDCTESLCGWTWATHGYGQSEMDDRGILRTYPPDQMVPDATFQNLVCGRCKCDISELEARKAATRVVGGNADGSLIWNCRRCLKDDAIASLELRQCLRQPPEEAASEAPRVSATKAQGAGLGGGLSSEAIQVLLRESPPPG